MPPRELLPVLPVLRLPEVSRTDRVLRRLLDLSAAVLLLAICAPVLLLVAITVKLTSPGPVFYRQRRVGLGGRLFSIWKFRTMFCAPDSGPLVTSQDDIRITPLGQRLRSWKLDELPQLFNVVCGEMSLVGPRPQVPRFVDCFPADLRRFVLSVRPGMTGPTALYFRHEEFLLSGRADREQFYLCQLLPIKLQMDAAYVCTRSLQNDLRVLADTVHLVVSRLTGRVGYSGIPAVCTLGELEQVERQQRESLPPERLIAAEPRTAVSKTA